MQIEKKASHFSNQWSGWGMGGVNRAKKSKFRIGTYSTIFFVQNSRNQILTS